MTSAPALTQSFSIRQSRQQLRWVWPGIMRRKQVAADITVALEQITDSFIEQFRREHPRARHAIIYRVGKHEVQLCDLGSEAPLTVRWIDHEKLLGQGVAFGLYAQQIEALRLAAREQRQLLQAA